MSSFCQRADRLVRSTPDADVPIVVDSPDAALSVIRTAMHVPQRHEVIVLLLDSDLRGHTIVIVDGTESPDAIIEVLELLAEGSAEATNPATFVVAAVRPDYGSLPGDGDRWLELCEIAETHGCELVEWFVLSGDAAWCPRDLIAEPPRWP